MNPTDKNTKIHFIYGCAILIILGMGYCLYRHLEWEKSSLNSSIEEQKSEITYSTNAQGKLIAEKQVAEESLRDFKKYHADKISDIQRQFGIKAKNIHSYYESQFKAYGKGNAEYVMIGDQMLVSDPDSVYDRNYLPVENKFDPFKIVISDGYLNLQTDVYSELKTPYEYIYTDAIKTVFHTKRKWLFGKERLYASSMLSNPAAMVTNTVNLEVKEYKDKRFGIGPYVGVDLLGQTNFGISVHWSLVKF